MRRFITFLICALALISGCSEQEKTESTVIEDNNVEEEKIETVQQQNTGQETNRELMNAIELVTIPETVEEWSQAKPGLLMAEETIETETSPWPYNNKLTDEMRDYLTEITTATQDVDTLFKTMIHLFGNKFYQELVTNQMQFDPGFTIPYLPEPELVKGQEGGEQNTVPDQAIILLDASSSMLLSVDNEVKMNIAKKAVTRFAKTIGEESEISLMIYGHAGSQNAADKQLSCTQIDEVYPMGKYNERQFSEAVNDVEAKGWTPLAGAIKKAYEATLNTDESITLFIVSDGAETCDGDPIAEAKAFTKGLDTRRVNIIGFNVDKKAEDQLQAVATAGNGEYLAADNIEELDLKITEQWIIPSALTVMGTKLWSPKGNWEETWAKHTLQGNHQKISFAVSRETNRFTKFINQMSDEEMISKEVYEQLSEKINAYHDNLQLLNDNLNQEKEEQIDTELERIEQTINEWAERVEKIREER